MSEANFAMDIPGYEGIGYVTVTNVVSVNLPSLHLNQKNFSISYFYK